jgi:uncharacterized membrane-anchored protein
MAVLHYYYGIIIIIIIIMELLHIKKLYCLCENNEELQILLLELAEQIIHTQKSEPRKLLSVPME